MKDTDKLFKELAQIIEQGMQRVTLQVNSTMRTVCWCIASSKLVERLAEALQGVTLCK